MNENELQLHNRRGTVPFFAMGVSAMLRATAAALPAPETPLAELATPALFLVNCYRLWTIEHVAPESDPASWGDGFRAAGIAPGGAVAFDALASLLIVGRQEEPLDLRCPCCPEISPDEARLIGVLGYLQRGAERHARTLLDLWLPPSLARLAFQPAEQLARAFTAADLPLQGAAVSGRKGRPARGGDHRGDPGLRLVH